MVAANGFAVDAGDAGDLTLWGAALQQRDDGGALVGFQDIHSLAFLRGRPEHASCPQVPTVSALRPCPRSIQVGEFEVAISGGVWVAISVHGKSVAKKRRLIKYEILKARSCLEQDLNVRKLSCCKTFTCYIDCIIRGFSMKSSIIFSLNKLSNIKFLK